MKKNWYLFAVLAVVLALLQQAGSHFPFTGVLPAPYAPDLAAPFKALSALSFLPL